MMREPGNPGTVVRVTGPVVQAGGMTGARMYEIVRVGKDELIGEIIALEGESATIQVYEETAGMIPGEPVTGTGSSLSVALGPGLLGCIFDGIQRPLEKMFGISGDFIPKGSRVPPLDRTASWTFMPSGESSRTVTGGDVLGHVQEGPIVHKVMVPPGLAGRFTRIADEGDYTLQDDIGILETATGRVPLTMEQLWPVRVPRPITTKLEPGDPLLTGQRVIDLFFPIAVGGTAAIPGPFGSGKTVVQHQLAKWASADIVVFVGCGERGNEMADVLTEFPRLPDPRTGEPLINRMVLIANTSNMPVAAREASVYTGITIAEYYRDMGYNVALMADSTSRWAEAMREISGRLEEMPGEEGYPAYLGSRLADFYERAGKVITIGKQPATGSVSVIGAVSPPGGDFSEPVTQNTLRMVKVFWALDSELAYRRHFPAINWLNSYSLYSGAVDAWWEENENPEWRKMREELMVILQRENELEELIKLVGPEVLPETDRLVLLKAEIIRESLLMQYAFHPHDTYTGPEKLVRMVLADIRFFSLADRAVALGVTAETIREFPVKGMLARMGTVSPEDSAELFRQIDSGLRSEFSAVGVESE
ncbi:V/A-type H+-transporting ATPase subunit A [Methanolinea mesophila]|uniref:V-type ATP synthase subunit A n=1 Tax=Methanolinea mesophila TaxID=547055 RepID=UPI001AE45C04|nr:V-type ATP synthase subunit A [Methanolinea mesophila]MBP1927530.1 V/A-type H+-transporting ATPase subunit A [Methanolinea mesophila]